MAIVIKPKRSGTASSVPTTSNLADGTVTTSEISAGTLVVESEGINSNDNDSTIPTSAATKDLVESTATALAIALG